MQLQRVGVLALIVAGILAAGCTPADAPVPGATPSAFLVIDEFPIKDDGSVYYFPAVGPAYREQLAKFLGEHPDLDCRYFGPDLQTTYPGRTSATTTQVGHTIVCQPKGKYAQDETRE